MMVDNDDVALHPSPAHLGDEASLPLAALLSGASVGAGVQLVPEQTGLGQLCKLGPVPGRGSLLPRRNVAILLNLFQPVEHGLIPEVVKFLAAQIIVPPLHVANPKAGPGSVTKQRLLQEWNVLIEKLFL